MIKWLTLLLIASFLPVAVSPAAEFSAPVGVASDSALSPAADPVPLALPTVETQPTSQTVVVGGTATFSFTASGSLAPTFTWQAKAPGSSVWMSITDHSIYSGESTTTLTITGATSAMNGTSYWCVLSNLSGTLATIPVTLTVTSLIAPKITWPQPASLRANLPLSSTQLNATADVPGHFTYSPAANTLLAPGTQVLTATFTPDDLTKYSVATAQVTLLVTAVDYAGTYFGSFAGSDAWALQVNPDSSAFFIGLSFGLRAVITARFTLAADGRISATATEITAFDSYATDYNTLPAEWVHASARTYTLSGMIASGHVGASLQEIGVAVTGDLDSSAAPTAGSYYTANSLGLDLGSAYAVVSPSGRAFVAAIGLGFTDAATGYLSSGGHFSATGCFGGTFTASLDSGTHAFSASLTPVDSTVAVAFGGLASGQKASSRLVNLSARAYCGVGNNVTIGGFVINGTGTKRVLIRAVGPSLALSGLATSEILADPHIELHHGSDIIATNDNWGDAANAAELTTVASQIGAAALAASDTKSSALLLTLSPGVYSFIVAGSGTDSGIVLLEIYDAEPTNTAAVFANISARALCTTGNGVTIGGFVVTGNAPKRALLRGVGPSLATLGLSTAEVLADPAIELHAGSSTIATNDNADSSTNSGLLLPVGARVGATPFESSDSRSSALLYNLQPGVYSFVSSGRSDTRGIVLIEIYDTD